MRFVYVGKPRSARRFLEALQTGGLGGVLGQANTPADWVPLQSNSAWEHTLLETVAERIRAVQAAESKIDTAQPLDLSRISVSSMPDAADVELDGKLVGQTPATLSVPPGEHVLSVHRIGFRSWRRKVTVLSNSSVTLKAELQPEGDSSRTESK